MPSQESYGRLARQAAKLARELEKLKEVSITGIPRNLILDRIANHINDAEDANARLAFEQAFRHSSQAEACLNILEIHDCGSIGGFDKGQPVPCHGFKGIKQRYIWLKGLKNE